MIIDEQEGLSHACFSSYYLLTFDAQLPHVFSLVLLFFLLLLLMIMMRKSFHSFHGWDHSHMAQTVDALQVLVQDNYWQS